MSETVGMDAYVPMPNTCHPHYEGSADGIRRHLGRDRHVVVAEPQRSLLASFDEPKMMSDLVIQPRTLAVRKVAGPAPFVGDPLLYQGWYFWFAAVDDLGRHVAGDATLEISFRP